MRSRSKEKKRKKSLIPSQRKVFLDPLQISSFLKKNYKKIIPPSRGILQAHKENGFAQKENGFAQKEYGFAQKEYGFLGQNFCFRLLSAALELQQQKIKKRVHQTSTVQPPDQHQGTAQPSSHPNMTLIPQ